MIMKLMNIVLALILCDLSQYLSRFVQLGPLHVLLRDHYHS